MRYRRETRPPPGELSEWADFMALETFLLCFAE